MTDRLRLLRDAGVVLAIAAVSVAALQSGHSDLIFKGGWWPEFWEVLPYTALTALRVWVFWGVAAAVIGGTLLRIEPRLDLVDAVLGGVTGVWVFAWIGGNLLGPIGLFRSWTIWTLLAAGGFWLWRTGPPRPPKIERPALSPGLKLTLLAFGIAAPGLLLVQLGSPVPPYMDVLAAPAAAQRILTFGRYLPFDNDPYGYWDAASQCPGVELFYALLALGSGTSVAVFAETAAIVPMVGLLMLATYRLGRALGDDIAGGMAALCLFATVFFRSMPYMHGRFVTFGLLATGLAFFLDQRRYATQLILAALILGTAVASHAIMGAFAMVVAAASILFWILSGELVATLAAIGLLGGATLVALPEVAVGLRFEVPYPVLPLAQLCGIVLAYVSARWLHERPVADGILGRMLRWALTIALVYSLARPNPKFAVLLEHWPRFPLLYVGAALGLDVMLVLDLRKPSRVLLGPIVLAIILGIGVDYVSRELWTTFTDGRMQTAVEDFHHKVDYWNPYSLLFPTGCLVAWVYRTVSPRLAVFALLAALFFPWKDGGVVNDPNYHQHSITQGWAFQLEVAKAGYWGSTGHRRWAQTAAELELADVLRAEVAAGRITPATHVVHLQNYILLYFDVALFSLYTGINDDGYIADYKFDRSIAGGRLRPMSEVYARLAEKPPYVVIHESTVNAQNLYDSMPRLPPETLQDYDEIFARDGVRLFRHRGVGVTASSS